MEKKDTNIKLPWYGIPRLLPYLKQYRTKIVIMVLIGAIVTAIDAIYPLFNRYVLNVVVAGNDMSPLPIVAAIYLILLVAQVIMNYYSTFMCSKMELWVNRDLRNASFGHLQTLSFSYFNQNNVGYIHARVMSDTGKIGELVSWRLMDMVWG